MYIETKKKRENRLIDRERDREMKNSERKVDK